MRGFLLFLFSLLLAASAPVYAQKDRFYSSLQGLSGTFLYGFFEDSKGYLWIPTYSGLNRFDGYSFKVYEHDTADSASINSINANVAFEDSKGRLWVGTNYGFNRYDYRYDNFERINIPHQKVTYTVVVKAIIEDKEGWLWLASSHGLVHFNPETAESVIFNHRFNGDGTPAHSKYNDLVQAADGNIWIGTDDYGVLVFDVTQQKFVGFNEYTRITTPFPDRAVIELSQDPKGTIYFGTQRAGLVVYKPGARLFVHVPHFNQPGNLFNSGVYSVLTDRQNRVWVGTESNGLKQYHPDTRQLTDANSFIDMPNMDKTKVYAYEDRSGDLWFGVPYRGIYHKVTSASPFHILGSSEQKNDKISYYVVKTILKDRRNNLWVGTDGGGINILKNRSSAFEPFAGSGGVKLTDKAIIKIFEDRKGRIWIGTYLEGLYCYDPVTEALTNYQIPGAEREKWNNYVFDIVEDAAGNIWLGTNGGGLYVLDIQTRQITAQSTPLVGNQTREILPFINALTFDADSTLWVGTYNGLFGWNKKRNTFVDILMSRGDWISDVVFALAVDRDNQLWIGTLAGLYRRDPLTGKLTRFTTRDGLCSNTISALQFDRNNNLWVSTISGISKFNRESASFQSYFEYDGLPDNEFRTGSSFSDPQGNLYFGSVDGLVWFHPDSIRDKNLHTKLVFTGFKIFNDEVGVPDLHGRIHSHINHADTITLRYTDKSFSLQFAAIDFINPEKIKYATRLEGFNSEWIITDYRQRQANYTNLNPGTYQLWVKWTNSDGIWNSDPRVLTIIVKPPFWRTWWAYLFYFILLFTAVYFSRKVALIRIHLKNQLHLENVKRSQNEEATRKKLQFFSNISHEIRTPLSMMLAPIEKLAATPLNESQKKQLSYLDRNTRRLERIIQQLLELQKIENTQLRLHARKMDLVAFTGEVVSLFGEIAREKQQVLSFESDFTQLNIWFDQDKMDKVLYNLLSNAVKFTPSGGLITVSLRPAETQSGPQNELVLIAVSDTGCGMKEEHFPRIFDRFYQIETNGKAAKMGTGIGLHLVKELIEIQHGKISVQSKPGEGTTFTILLPQGDAHLKPEEKVDETASAEVVQHLQPVGEEFSELEDFAQLERNGDQVLSVLIVEDDTDILNYLSDELSSGYRILRANNGTEGWKLAFDQIPDLIITDIMMPGLNGLQLCKKVKTTLETSHVPVIMLTARTTTENEIEGLEVGADEYVKKPFHPKVLRIKVDKLIESRNRLKERFSKGNGFTVKEMTVTSADEKFLQRAIDYVMNNLADPELNIESMSSELNISRVHLYRKLKAITNQNPSEFIRTIRLKQAAYLLSKGKLNISEVAYMVGFNSHQYFTNSFQKHFTMSPTEYARKNGAG